MGEGKTTGRGSKRGHASPGMMEGAQHMHVGLNMFAKVPWRPSAGSMQVQAQTARKQEGKRLGRPSHLRLAASTWTIENKIKK